MKGRNVIMAIAIILIAVLLAGEASIYALSPYSYDSDAEVREDGIDYMIESSVNSEYDIVVMDNGDVPRISELIMVSIGGNYPENIRKELIVRGFDDVIVKEPSEIAELADQPSSGKGILIPYGQIPEELYDGESTDPLVKWLEGGGTVYWFGYIPKEGYDLSPLGLSEDDFWSSDRPEDYKVGPASPFCKSLKLRNHSVRYGLNVNAGTPLAYTSESGYSSITSVEVLNGTMIIFGGGGSSANSIDCAQIIASGVTHDTTVMEYESGFVKDIKRSSIRYSDEIGTHPTDGIFTYIYIGGYYLVYGGRHE